VTNGHGDAVASAASAAGMALSTTKLAISVNAASAATA
jgi:hypothetical protein